MSALTVLLICAQALLVQNVYSQCLGAPYRYGLADSYAYGADLAPANLAAANLAAPGLYNAGLYGSGLVPAELAGIGAPLGAYGGAGVGDVAVVGELPVAGTTLIAGQVPILGAVRFAGDLPAAGTVTIAGSSGCGCNSYYY